MEGAQMIKLKRMTECTEREFKERILEDAKQTFDLRVNTGVTVDEAFATMMNYVYDQAHNRGTYDARR